MRLRALVLVATLLAASAVASCRSAGAPQERLEPGGTFEEGLTATVTIEGHASFSDEQLSKVIAGDLEGLERRSSPKAAVDDAAYSLELFYRAEGFPGCQVDYTVDEYGPNRLRATLQVVEGPRVAIGEVRFEGNQTLADEELVPFLKPRARGLLAGGPTWYVERRVESSLDALAAYYQGQGFLDVRVRLVPPGPARGESPWSERLDLTLEVQEGPRYVLRRIELEGGVAEVDAGLDRGPFLGRPLSPRTPRGLRGRLVELYGRAGYPDVRVEVEQELEPSGDAKLRFRIEPGDRVTIGSVRVEGNRRTRLGRILATLELEQGERWDLAAERQSFRNLYRLGVFSSVDLQLEGEGPERELVVSLQESHGRELYFEPGYGSYEELRLGIGWRERNLFGGARVLDVEGRLSDLAQRGVVGVTDPRFLDTATSANLSVFVDRREEPSFSAIKIGSSLTFSRRLRRDFELSAGYQFRFSDLIASDILDPTVQNALTDVNISSVSITPSWDTRDSAFVPRDGAQARMTVEYGDELIGSELDFVRTRWTLAWFETLGADSVLGLSWRAGLIAPIQTSDTIPIQERYFNGGENTVRSFREDQLGPSDAAGNPIGGEAFNVLTAELRQRLAGRLEGALFYDTGNLIEDYTEYLRMRGFRHALGAGLRYVLPVGPLRLDWGWNPDPAPGEADYALHFSVGLAF